MPNIAVLDFEAQSASTSTGKIISVSGILYNDDFQELDRFELFCRNVPGYIPDPYSLWVNKGLKNLKESNRSHYQLMIEMHKYINKWSPCIWATWNGHELDKQTVNGVNELVEQCHEKAVNNTQKQHLENLYQNLTYFCSISSTQASKMTSNIILSLSLLAHTIFWLSNTTWRLPMQLGGCMKASSLENEIFNTP